MYFFNKQQRESLVKNAIRIPVRVVRGYNLTTKMDLKVKDAIEFNGVTVFINNKHNLAHVLHGGDTDGETMHRMRKLSKDLKVSSDAFIKEYFQFRIIADTIRYLS